MLIQFLSGDITPPVSHNQNSQLQSYLTALLILAIVMGIALIGTTIYIFKSRTQEQKTKSSLFADIFCILLEAGILIAVIIIFIKIAKLI